ncbi:hypothetical protein ACOBQX_25805 [Actinokineospora sp. G85]|uniref:hypothetical protein n=1 Tax=Actinokineospora sp. G85 TaxID=3406626 RepID=UPI003C77AD73
MEVILDEGGPRIWRGQIHANAPLTPLAGCCCGGSLDLACRPGSPRERRTAIAVDPVSNELAAHISGDGCLAYEMSPLATAAHGTNRFRHCQAVRADSYTDAPNLLNPTPYSIEALQDHHHSLVWPVLQQGQLGVPYQHTVVEDGLLLNVVE